MKQSVVVVVVIAAAAPAPASADDDDDSTNTSTSAAQAIFATMGAPIVERVPIRDDAIAISKI